MRAQRSILLTTLPLLFALFFGCSVARVLFKEQEWSDNYVRYPGTTCSEPKLADGDRETPVQVPRQVIISFPRKFTINKILVFRKNVKDMKIFASVGRDEWKEIAQVKNDRKPDIEFRVFTSTTQLMLRFGETTDDTIIPGQINREIGIVQPHLKVGIPTLAEIEIYGYKEAEPEGGDLIF